MPITSTGIASGIDVEGLVSQLVSAERTPAENRLNQRQQVVSAQLSAYGTLKSALSTFQASLTDVKKLSTFQKRTVDVSDSDSLAVTASKDAVPGSFSVSVSKLATAHSLASMSFASTDTVVGEGTLAIRFGTTDYDAQTETYNGFTVNPDRATASILIDSSNNTLAGVRDAINAADAGVSATIVNDGSGYRLLVSSTSTGAENGIEISAVDQDGNNTDQSGLSRLAFNASANYMTQTAAAEDAQVTINGLAVSSATNSLDGAIDGLSIDLKAVTTSPVTVNVKKNAAAIKTAIQGLANGYRAFNAVANQLSKFDQTTQQGNILLGDATLRSITSRVRQVLNSPVDNISSAFATLSEIGITTDATGSLNIDDTKLSKIVDEHFDEIAGLFAPTGNIADNTVNFVGSTSKTIVGEYGVAISQLATQGSYTGSGVLPNFGSGGTVTIDASNDNLTFEVDGIAGSAISLTQGTYSSGAELAKELESRINDVPEFKTAGITVTVNYDDIANTLTVTSDPYGSSSSVNIIGIDGTTTATLGIAVGDGVAGVDVAGTIGGVAGVGKGQVLSGAEGTDAQGMTLTIEGGGLGDRGTLSFTRGIGDQLDSLINSLLAEDGILGARQSGLNASLDRIDKDREDLDVRMSAIEARYRSQFTALDLMVSQLQSTSSYLTSALASIPTPGSRNQQ
ncbi:MAG: flagellar filament capping protein FliD [Pseudomonadales bacterium]|nr:flagellar filament capping protein FliD [Pseudomonadales bacterium]